MRGAPDRTVAVLGRPPAGAAPPGVAAADFALALLEDTYEVVADMVGVRAALAVCPPGYAAAAEQVAWAGTPLYPIVAVGPAAETLAVLDALTAAATETPAEGVVVAGDAPDLPGLLLAKMFAAFTSAEVAVCPCEGGGLVALGCRLPVPDWLRAAEVGLDVPDALDRLRAAAPPKRLAVGPGWRRLRAPVDIAGLDPGLEGWAATRSLLTSP